MLKPKVLKMILIFRMDKKTGTFVERSFLTKQRPNIVQEFFKEKLDPSRDETYELKVRTEVKVAGSL